jgi:dihydropyrimidinase
MTTLYDTVIKGGLVATPGHDLVCDIAIRDGRIAALGQDLVGETEIDAQGMIVTPGGIDAHCHIDQLTSTGARTADTFASASRAAACGGTTTMMPFAVQHAAPRWRRRLQSIARVWAIPAI